MIKQKAMFFVEEIYFQNVKASDVCIDKTTKVQETYGNTVNEKFIFLSQLFTDVLSTSA